MRKNAIVSFSLSVGFLSFYELYFFFSCPFSVSIAELTQHRSIRRT